jgi:DNA primase
MNTPETPVYHKRESLYGIHLAKDAIKKDNNVLLVEGEFDMIAPYQHSIENVVAIKGAAVTKEQLTILKRLTSKITFALDGDAAGIEAMKKAIMEAEQMDFELYVLDWQTAKDPDEMVRTNLSEFKNKLKSPISVYDFVIQVALKKNPGDSPFGKKKIGEEVAPFISTIKNPIILSHYTKKLSKLLEISEESIQVLLRNVNQKTPKPVDFLPKAAVQPKQSVDEIREKYLLSCLFQNEHVYTVADMIASSVSPHDFSVVAYQKIFDLFLQFKATHKENQIKEFCDSLPAELQSVCNELYLYNNQELEQFIPQSSNEEMLIKRIALDIRWNSLKNAINRLNQDDSLNDDILRQKSVELNEVDKKRKLLYNY